MSWFHESLIDRFSSKKKHTKNPSTPTASPLRFSETLALAVVVLGTKADLKSCEPINGSNSEKVPQLLGWNLNYGVKPRKWDPFLGRIKFVMQSVIVSLGGFSPRNSEQSVIPLVIVKLRKTFPTPPPLPESQNFVFRKNFWVVVTSSHLPGGGLKHFFVFIPTSGNDPIWLYHIFQNGLNWNYHLVLFFLHFFPRQFSRLRWRFSNPATVETKPLEVQGYSTIEGCSHQRTRRSSQGLSKKKALCVFSGDENPMKRDDDLPSIVTMILITMMIFLCGLKVLIFGFWRYWHTVPTLLRIYIQPSRFSGNCGS